MTRDPAQLRFAGWTLIACAAVFLAIVVIVQGEQLLATRVIAQVTHADCNRDGLCQAHITYKWAGVTYTKVVGSTNSASESHVSRSDIHGLAPGGHPGTLSIFVDSTQPSDPNLSSNEMSPLVASILIAGCVAVAIAGVLFLRRRRKLVSPTTLPPPPVSVPPG